MDMFRFMRPLNVLCVHKDVKEWIEVCGCVRLVDVACGREIY